MNFFANFLNQIEILCIGITLLNLRKLIAREDFDDVWSNIFSNKYFTAYLMVLWFLIIPWMATYFRWEPFGIWGLLYKQSIHIFWLTLIIVIIFNCLMLYQVRTKAK